MNKYLLASVSKDNYHTEKHIMAIKFLGKNR